MTAQKRNVLITFDSHTPYLVYRITALQAELERRGLADQIRLRVLLLGASDSSYSWEGDALNGKYDGVPVAVLTEKFHGLGFKAYFSKLAFRTTWKVFINVLKERPKVAFVGGYDRPASLLIAAMGKIFRWKTGPMHDSRFNDAESYSKKVFLEAVKSPFMRLYDFFMCSGRECIDYTHFLAGPKRPAHFAGWNVIDNAGIAAKAEDASKDDALLSAMGLQAGEPFFFMPIRFLEKKNIFRVLEAYHRARHSKRLEGHPLARLIIAGKGPLRDQVRETIKENGLAEYIHLMDWIEYDQIPRAARLSQAVILGSTHDQWGLIVNEALSAGAPVLVSNRCGAHELVQNALNGFTFDPYDVKHLAELLVDLSSNPFLVDRLRANAASSMNRFSIKQFTDAWITVFTDYGLLK
jgi:glycosyltransferase involved in cell wall biosynthesis